MIAISVENRKGGVAKTTTAVNLALGISRRVNGRVLLLDIDPQGDAARALGIKPADRCISGVLLGDPLRDHIIPASRPDIDRPNLFLLPATDRLKEAKERILSQLAAAAATAVLGGHHATPAQTIDDYVLDKLRPLSQVFSYIIIDCPPTLDILQRPIHRFANYAVVPVKLDYHGVAATGNHTRNIIADQIDTDSATILAVLPTFVDARLNLTKTMIDALTATYGRRVLPGIPNTVKVAEAPAAGGLALLEYAPDTPAALAYENVVDYVLREAQ